MGSVGAAADAHAELPLVNYHKNSNTWQVWIEIELGLALVTPDTFAFVEAVRLRTDRFRHLRQIFTLTILFRLLFAQQPLLFLMSPLAFIFLLSPPRISL